MSAAFSIEQARLWKDLSAVAYALIDAKGHLIESNKGFEMLLPPALRKTGSDVRVYFVNPEFRRLAVAEGQGPGRKIFTVGIVEGKTFSLNGWFVPYDGNYMFLAEHDISGIAKVSDTLLDINKELSRLQRDLLSANRRLKVREQQIRELSLTDALTGVANRRRLDEALEAAISHAGRHKRALSVVMADIDNFKTVNDDFGHDTGDRALRAFAELLKLRSRKYDLVARYGGEEFIVLMPECDMSHARTSAERMRKEVALLNIPPADRPMTASFGVSQWLEADTAQSLLARADAAMYQAKAKGRNRVETKKA